MSGQEQAGTQDDAGSSVRRRKGPRFGMTDPDVVRDPTLDRNIKTIYGYLATFCGETRSGFPGRARMARETGLSLSALDVAKKAGADCGLWTIERRPARPGDPECKELTSNRYWLHDFADGYKPGSGPGARPKGKPRGRKTTPSQPQEGDPSQNQGDGLPESGQEEDNGARPLSTSNTTSTDNAPCADQSQAPDREKINAPCAGSSQAPPARDGSNLFLPKDFHDRPLKAARGYLIRATTAALAAQGHTLSVTAKKYLGQNLRTYGQKRAARDEMAAMIRDGLTDAARFAATLEAGQPFDPPPMPDFDVDALDIDDQIGAYVKEVLGSPMGEGTRSMVNGRLGGGEPVRAIVNDALCMERGLKPGSDR